MQIDPRFQERIGVIITVIIGIFGAIFLGKITAQGQTSTLTFLGFGVAGIASLIHFRERIWVIIPVLWPFYGAVQILPLPFAVKDLAVMAAFGAIVVCIALKIVRRKPAYTYLDAILYINAIWLFIALVRNPVGFLATDSERVGGRPYVSAVFGMLAYWTLARLSASPQLLRRAGIYAVSAVTLLFIINAGLIFAPNFAGIAIQLYSGFDMYFVEGVSNAGRTAIDEGTVRIELFRDIGKYSFIFLCAYFYPPSLLNPINWKRFLAFAATMLGLLLSGFRSFLIYAGGMFLIGSYFRKGWTAVFRSSLIAMLAALIVMLGHGTIYELPFAAQRALAVIPEFIRPVKLDERAILAGTSSTDWRVEMWIQALTTNRYISDKILGDGFGMTRAQVAIFQKVIYSGVVTTLESQEQMAVSGDFHSGPVSAIRVVGIVGLIFVYLLYIPLAIHAVRIIRRTKGTPFFTPTLFFCMPVVFEPFWYTFIFGGYSAVIPFAGLSLGMIKLIENSLDAYQTTQALVENPASVSPRVERSHISTLV